MSAGQKSECPGATGQDANLKTDSGDRTPDAKTFATVAAHFALKGHSLLREELQGGIARFTVHNWGQSRHFACWADVEAFLRQIGGRNV